ncbi:MAG: DUF4337 family protein [Candidatus Nanopelagicales bacterium]|jgi:hypothetical protein|nr:DUF4337 family protein [Candidatus Nanopelagicales bacterium]
MATEQAQAETESGGIGITQGALAITAAVLLGIAAVLTAWSAYRESLTSDLVLKSYSEQQATIALANDTYGRADQQESLEISLFLEWAIAVSAGNVEASGYLEQVMSSELYAAVEWWQVEPEDTTPPTPFDPANPNFVSLPSQVLVAEGDALLEEAETLRAAAEAADSTSDRYDLANVFFAVVLFIAGLTTIVQRRSIQLGFIALSILGLVAGIVVLVTTTGWASLT